MKKCHATIENPYAKVEITSKADYISAKAMHCATRGPLSILNPLEYLDSQPYL